MLGYMAKGIKVAGGIKASNQLTLNKEMTVDSSGGPHVITQIHQEEEGRSKERQRAMLG